jgi:hypothetical protein
MQAKILLYFYQQNYSLLETFSNVIDTIVNWKNADDLFQGLAVEGKESFNNLLENDSEMTVGDIVKIASGYNHSENLFASGVAFECWRFKGGEAYRGHSRMDIDAWGFGHEMSVKRDVAVEGLCRLYLNNSGQFCAVIGEKENEYKEANERVQNNLDDLTDLQLSLASSVNPMVLRVVPDGGLSIPLNSNSTFFSSYSDVIADLNFIGKIWEDGLPKYQEMPPLKNYDPEPHEYLLHEWRTESQRHELWNRLSRVVDRIPSVTESNVESILKSGRFDFYETDEYEGFLVLEEPFYFNNFIDRFYLEILEKV